MLRAKCRDRQSCHFQTEQICDFYGANVRTGNGRNLVAPEVLLSCQLSPPTIVDPRQIFQKLRQPWLEQCRHATSDTTNSVPTLLLRKKSRTFPGQHEKFARTFSEPANAFIFKKQSYNIQSVDHCRKFRQWQNSSTFHTVFNSAIVNTNWVLHYCCLCSIWSSKWRTTFNDIFQDFPKR